MSENGGRQMTRCKCGGAFAGALAGGRLKDDQEKTQVTIHLADGCFVQEIGTKWWEMFMNGYFGPAQAERRALAEQLACVLDAVGGQVRFHKQTTVERVAPTDFKVELEMEADGHVTIKSPVSRITLATHLPAGVTPLRRPGP